jgi:hypothetical protein
LGDAWESVMIGREYFARQAETLLRFAKSVKDPALSAELVSKAAVFEEKAEEVLGEQPLITPAIREPAK